MVSFISLEREVCPHAEEEQKLKNQNSLKGNIPGPLLVLSAQGNCKQMYQSKYTVFASLLSPFLTELGNSGLGRASEGQTENIWWFLQWKIKNEVID